MRFPDDPSHREADEAADNHCWGFAQWEGAAEDDAKSGNLPVCPYLLGAESVWLRFVRLPQGGRFFLLPVFVLARPC